MKELDRIVLTADIPGEELKAGDVGTIVHVYGQGEAFEVEFLALDGNTVALAEVLPSQARPVTGYGITHTRKVTKVAWRQLTAGGNPLYLTFPGVMDD